LYVLMSLMRGLRVQSSLLPLSLLGLVVAGVTRTAAVLGGHWWPLAACRGVRQAEANEVPPALEPLDRKALLAQHRASIEDLRREAESKLSDQDLLAHWRAATLNGQSPALRVRETDAWRRSSGIETKLSNKAWQKAERELRQVLKCDHLGLDKYGRPILVQRVGAWDVGAVEAVAEDIDRFTMLNAMVCEKLLRTSRPPSSKDPRGVVVIMDMEGLGLSHLSTKMLYAFSSVSKVIRTFYPDMLAYIFVVRAPWVFTAVKAALRPLLTAKTLSNLQITADVPQELQSLGEALPIELGGTRKRVFPFDESAPPS